MSTAAMRDNSIGQFRPTARQVVRDDAKAFGWELIPTQFIDLFMRDDELVSMAWTVRDSQRIASNVLHFEGSELVDTDASPLCIVRCRELLRGQVNLSAPLPASSAHEN